jgi:type II secretory pathway component PulF
MPLFTFEAVNDAGTRAAGRRRAPSEAALARDLEARGLHVLAVRESAPPPVAPWQAARRRREVLEATRAIASLLAAGLSLARALDAARDVTSGLVRDALDDVRARVERGESIAGALRAFPDCFPPLYTGIVQAGDRSGDLVGAFARLAAQLERAEQLRGRVLSATLYPILLLVAGAFAVVALLVIVLPRFATLLADAGAPLPGSTRVLLAASALLGRTWPLLAALLLAAPAVLWWTRRTDDGRAAAARLLLAVPGVRTLRRDVLGARVARLLAALLGGGAPLYGALGDVLASLDDPVAREAVRAVRERVRTGASLGAALAADALFPPLLVQLTGVGEAAAQLDDFLRKAADLLDERTARTAQRLATLAEPALIVGLGIVVAAIAYALLQAIYGLNAGGFAR